MGTIAQELTRIQTAKTNLKTSIENKGVQVPSNALIDSYSGYVDQISGGGTSFDNCNFCYLLSNWDAGGSSSGLEGRFLDSLDDIYNSDQSGLPNLSFKNYAAGVIASSNNVQKIFDIVKKFFRGATVYPSQFLVYTFCNLSPSDADRIITFDPELNLANNIITFSRTFSYYGDQSPSGVKSTLRLDFDKFNVKGIRIAYSEELDFSKDKVEVSLLNFPIRNIYGPNTLYFGTGSNHAAFKEITLKYGLTSYTSTSVTTLNFKYCTNMTLDKWINLFNSVGSTTMSGATITIPSTIYNQLTAEQKAIVTDKGYTLTGA